MAVTVQGIDELKYLLQQNGERAVRGVLDQMRKEAKSIQELAVKMAPVDHGNLEEAIKVRDAGGGRSNGRFMRKSVEVFVDGSIPVPERPGKTIADYAWEMHQHLTPYGFLRLGEKSQAKQQGQQVQVGGGFLERAVDKVSEQMMNRLIAVARQVL